jgi:hypothetical protein
MADVSGGMDECVLCVRRAPHASSHLIQAIDIVESVI